MEKLKELKKTVEEMYESTKEERLKYSNKIKDHNYWVIRGELNSFDAVLHFINKLLNIEKEIGVSSTSTTKDGVLHSVRDSHASDIQGTEEVHVNGSLKKRTEAKEVCKRCNGSGYLLYGGTPFDCKNCGGTGKLVDS